MYTDSHQFEKSLLLVMCSHRGMHTNPGMGRGVELNFTAVEGGDNSSYAGSEAREVFINTSSDISGVNK